MGTQEKPKEDERFWLAVYKNLAHMTQCAPLEKLVMNVNVCVREQNIASL